MSEMSFRTVDILSVGRGQMRRVQPPGNVSYTTLLGPRGGLLSVRSSICKLIDMVGK